MRDHNYIVRFQRRDKLPDEEYVYYERKEAEKHLDLFQNDDSGLYTKASLLAWFGDITSELRVISFER